MRVCVIASSRYPIVEPFAGGLESWTHALVTALHARGHEVTLFAAPGSDPALPVTVLPVAVFEGSEAAYADVNAPSVAWMSDHHAYLALMLALRDAPYDVVHNSSLHHLPVAMASSLRAPVVTTLHTPPVPWLESAVSLARGVGTFVAVSDCTARAWGDDVAATVIRNGVDTEAFTPGPGGGPVVWSGRLTAEKAPHLAIEAARLAGLPLVLAGPVSDPVYVAEQVRPLLGAGVEYAGHLRRAELIDLLGAASAALVTPEWEEPYGLVAAEAMACGTPVAAFARGALPQLVVPTAGVLAPAGDVAALAAALRQAVTLDRAGVRAHAETECSLARMVDDYERLYAAVAERRAA